MFGSGLAGCGPKVWPFVGNLRRPAASRRLVQLYWTGEKVAGGRNDPVNPPVETLSV